MITGLAHINLTVPPDTLDLARDFYANTLGLSPRPVPQTRKGMLAWFDIGNSGQQVHIAFGENESHSPRHPCFQLPDGETLVRLQEKIWEHFEMGRKAAKLAGKQEMNGEMNGETNGVNGMHHEGVNGTETNGSTNGVNRTHETGNLRSKSAPREADRPGIENSGLHGADFPMRFFARDYAGNRLEFSL